MSVVTAVCMIFTLMTFYIFSYDLIFAIELVNIVAMLGLWLAYATTVKSPPAQWLHPFQRPPATTSEKPSTADVNMQQVKKSNLPGSTV